MSLAPNNGGTLTITCDACGKSEDTGMENADEETILFWMAAHGWAKEPWHDDYDEDLCSACVLQGNVPNILPTNEEASDVPNPDA